MALYKETSYDDWARRQRQSLQNSAQNLQQKQAGLQAAQNQKQKTTLESALSGLIGGLKERGSDILNTANNIGKTVVGAVGDTAQRIGLKSAQKDDSKRRNEIAKKYGFNSYSEAANSGNASQEFWNEIKDTNKQTKQKLESNKANLGTYGDVTKVNTNEAKGQALNTIDSVLGLLPGGIGVAANIAGGGLSGIGDEYKRAGREGNDFNWENARNNAIVGAASGLAGSAGGAGMGRFASKAGTNALGKLAGTQLAKGIAGGAAAGAVGGGLGTYLNGGSLEDALLAAKEGAKAGGIGGGVMAGAMGLGGKALDKFRGRAGNAPVTDIEPVEATTVQKNRIDQPTAQRIEAEAPSTRRGIAITDLDAGEQEVNVRNGRPTENRGKYIDSFVKRADANLPEAQRPTLEQRFTRQFDSPLEQIIANGDMGDGIDILDVLKNSGVKQPELAAMKSGARSYANDTNPFAAYGMTSRGDLPLLDRQEYYNDNMGKIGRAGNGGLTTEDVPSYMRDRLKNDAGKGRYSSADNESIMREVFGDNMSKEDMYRLYEDLADTTQASPYTSENFGYALSLDPELSARVQRAMLEQAAPTRKISIESALTQAQPVDITDMTTNYRKSTIPARQYEQTVNNIPEAETTANRAVASAPEQRIATQEPERQVAVSPSDQARLEREITVKEQKQGKALLEQYGPLDRPTRRAVGDPAKVLANLQDKMGLTTPAEVQYAANHITGGDGILAKATNRLASLTTVDTRLEPTFIESLIEKNGLTEADAKAVRNQINGTFKKLGQNRKYTNGADVLDQVKQLQGIVRDYKGESGTYHNMTDAQKFKVNVIEAVAQELEDRLWDSADANMSQVITPELLTSMKQMYPDNAKWQNFVDNTVANAKTGKELRAIQKPLVQAGKIVRGSNMSSGSVGEAIANGAVQAGGVKGAAKNVAKVVADKFINSPKQQQRRANKYQQQKQAAEAQLYGEAPVTANTSRLGTIANKAGNIAQGAKNLASGAAERINNATANLNNETLSNIGLNGGLTLGTYLANQANRQIGYGQARDAQERMANAQALSQAQNDYDNALASYQNEEQQVNNAIAQAQAMQSPLGRIEQAMTLALNAGDINAYSQLADLYQQAAKIEELKNPTAKNEGKALSANQAKALTAQQQLEMLSTMTPNAGTVAANIPGLNKIVNLTGGNEYDNQADALATTLGYLLSGANIKESEAKRIGKAYVPTAFDSEAVRQQKLDRAAQLIQSYMSDTGALAA